MYKGPIIDAHAHVYPEKISEKAVRSIEGFYNLYAECDGTLKSLIESGKEFNVVKFLIHSTATKKEQVHNINDFIINSVKEHDCFIGYGTLHYDLSPREIIEETERIAIAGISGIKLHPDCQKFLIDDKKMNNIYLACRDNNLPILMHTGDERYDNSRPERMANTARNFPTVEFIAAHFGGYVCWDSLSCYTDTHNVMFDTCSSLFKMQKGQAESIIEKFGSDRFFFGTDYPLFNYENELKRFFKLDLDEETQEKILYKNAANFLKV